MGVVLVPEHRREIKWRLNCVIVHKILPILWQPVPAQKQTNREVAGKHVRISDQVRATCSVVDYCGLREVWLRFRRRTGAMPSRQEPTKKMG